MIRHTLPPGTPRSRAGTSIIEILVALTILVFGVYMLYEQFIGTGRRSREQALRTQARYLAHEKLEELLACRYDELAVWTVPPVPSPLPADIRFTAQPSMHRRTDGLLDVSVQVGWNVQQGTGFQPGNSVEARGVKTP